MDPPKETDKLKEDDKGPNTESVAVDTSKKRPIDATETPAGDNVAETGEGEPQTGEGEPPKKISKNQQKKQRRLQRAMEVKQRRKQQEKEAKRAKALAQGRDLDQERRDLEERTASGENKRKRQEQWERSKVPLLDKSFKVCVDCYFGPSMTPKELNSLALQIRYCYSSNRTSPHPCHLAITSLNGATAKHMDNVSGYDEWKTRAFTGTSQPLEEYYSKDDLKNVVYLTSDAEHTLTDLDDSKIYVIGGIVDRNRLKRAAIDRATSLGVATARLPLDDHLKMTATKVLTCNHVFDILLKFRQHGRDWKKALNEVLPNRKGAVMLESDTKDEPKESAAKEEPGSSPLEPEKDESIVS